MSRCAQVRSLVNLARNAAAVMEPPSRPATLAMSAKLLLSCSPYSSVSGMCQARSSTAAPQSTISRARRVVVREYARVVHAERDDNGARQRGHVDDDRGLETPRVMKRVAEDQAAFGVGVEDFDGETGGAGDDVAGLDGAAIGHVFAGGDQADDVERQIELGHGLHRADDAGRAAHVEFHFVHGRAGL